MKKLLKAFTLFFISIFLYSCVTGSFTQTGNQFPPYTGIVKVFNQPPNGLRYQEVGIISAKGGDIHSRAEMIKALQLQAAKYGTNAIILTGIDEKKISSAYYTRQLGFFAGTGTAKEMMALAIRLQEEPYYGAIKTITNSSELNTENSRSASESAQVITNKKALEYAELSYQSILKKNWSEVIRTASAAISLEPSLIDPYINRAWAYTEKGFYKEAIQDSEKALEIDPLNKTALNNRGYAYQKMGNIEKAKADYLEACSLGFELSCKNFEEITGFTVPTTSNSVEQLLNQSLIEFKKRNWDGVITLTSKVIEIAPNNEIAYTNRSAAFTEKRLFSKAFGDADKAIQINPDYALAYNNRGFAFERYNRLKEAALNYEIACNLGLSFGCKNFERISTTK